jgi:urease accessory protein
MTLIASELVPYLDEPKQLPSGKFGKDAQLHLRFEARESRSILAKMERKAPLLVQRALYCDEGMPILPVVYIITNSGGILQGDRYTLNFSVGPGGCGHITTQAATKIHEMDANYAAQTQEILLEEGSYLEYLPETVIPFRHSRFHTRTRIRIAPTATLLYSEVLLGGRQFYQAGELFEFDLFSSWVSGERLDGTNLFVEKFLIEPQKSPISRLGVMGDFSVFGNVILLTPPEHTHQIYSQVDAVWNKEENWAAGASLLPNDAGLIYKVLGPKTSVVHDKIRNFWSLVRHQVTGFSVPPKFPWH